MRVRRRIQVTGFMVLGLLLLQTAWILAMPPFGALDEFDHAYRASAVAHGEIFTDLGLPDDGRGLLVSADDGLPEAARVECEFLRYTGRDNCNALADLGDGLVAVSSSAAIYQPTYYLLVGWVMHFMDGAPALYAMRIVSSLVCAALWGLAVWVVTGWARSPWPLIAMPAVLTPTIVYTGSVVAPNGFEVTLGLLLWVCLIGTVRAPDPMRVQRLLIAAVPTAGLFAWTRPFSPVWLFFILAAWLLLLGLTGVRRLLREHLRTILVGTVAVAVAAFTSAHWVLTHTTGEPPIGYVLTESRWGKSLEQIPLWFFQVISGVPYRNNPATPDVYIAGVVLFAFLLLPFAWRGADRRVRWSGLFTIGAALGVGLWYSYSRMPTAGPLWQGRYAWCLALGAVLLAALLLEDHRAQRTKWLGLLFGVPAFAVMQVRALYFVVDLEATRSPSVGSADWVTAPVGVVVTIGVGGILAWFIAARMAWLGVPGSNRETQHVAHTVDAS